MAEKKPTKRSRPKQDKLRIKNAEERKLFCNVQLSDGSPCPKTVGQGKLACRWHNLEDEAWGENHELLESTPPEQERDFVLSCIKAHPEHKLALPKMKSSAKDILRYLDYLGFSYGIASIYSTP